jgi:hypothetical protein
VARAQNDKMIARSHGLLSIWLQAKLAAIRWGEQNMIIAIRGGLCTLLSARQRQQILRVCFHPEFTPDHRHKGLVAAAASTSSGSCCCSIEGTTGADAGRFCTKHVVNIAAAGQQERQHGRVSFPWRWRRWVGV